MAERDVKRQAVVIIHGIGEQRPMDTLRSFVSALSSFDREGSRRVMWSKPDKVSAGFEHRMLSLAATSYRPRTDVYELYWAHLADPTEEPTFLSWLFGILGRQTPLLPERFRRIKLAGIIVLFGVLLGAAMLAWLLPLGAYYAKLAAVPMITILVGFVGFKVSSIYRGTIVDVSRYFDAHPKNVRARNRVRALGVEFLENLHNHDRSYDRIVLCGHSLGSAIGYDILQHLWFRMHEQRKNIDRPDRSAKKSLYQAIKNQQWAPIAQLQSHVFEEQKRSGNRWRITDFITLGSPLAHADLILAESESEFEARMSAGELSACPPRLQQNSKRLGFLRKYEIKGGEYRSMEMLNHRSVFASTRWTNIYFPVHKIILGDPIAGPLAPIFGPGVTDIDVDLPELKNGFRHLDYWRSDPKNLPISPEGRTRPLAALKSALRLDWSKIGANDINDDLRNKQVRAPKQQVTKFEKTPT